MCRDVQDSSSSLHKYEEQFPAFADSREYKLLQVIQLHTFSLVLHFSCRKVGWLNENVM